MKLVEPDGAMLALSWEAHAEALARCETDAELLERVQEVARAEGIALSDASAMSPRPRVLIGRDTRPTSGALLQATLEGARCMGAEAVDMGLTTTPQLHFAVLEENEGRSNSEAHYLDTLLGAYRELTEGLTHGSRGDPTPLIVDCANGVGGPKLRELQTRLAGARLQLELRNCSASPELLNDQCGADHVQKEQRAPRGFTAEDAGARCCAIDGDADRLVYFRPLPAPPVVSDAEAPCSSSSLSSSMPISLFDGDRIAILAAEYIGGLVRRLPPAMAAEIRVGVVQTAYANGASTKYLRETLGLEVLWAKTGVKHLHRAAERFPIGVYFESNGHGTVLFHPSVRAALQRFLDDGSGEGTDDALSAAKELWALLRLINQAVGDAISCLLLVEVILARKGWTLREWSDLYADLPSRQLKVVVPDRTFIRCAEDESRAVWPGALQEEIDALVAAQRAQGRAARAFVRPSGTEDLVRVYAESASQEGADALAREVAALVGKHAQIALRG